LEREGVEADAFSGWRRSCQFIIEGEDAVGGGEGEVGMLVGSDSTRHLGAWGGICEQVGASETPTKEQCHLTVLKI
jgi:hypothetical protein